MHSMHEMEVLLTAFSHPRVWTPEFLKLLDRRLAVWEVPGPVLYRGRQLSKPVWVLMATRSRAAIDCAKLTNLSWCGAPIAERKSPFVWR